MEISRNLPGKEMSLELVHHYFWGCKPIYSTQELNFQFQVSPPVRRLTAFSLSPFYIAPLYFIAQFIASRPYSFWSSWSGKHLQLLLSVASLVMTPLISWFRGLPFSRAPVHSSLLNRWQSKLVRADLCPLVPSSNSLGLNRGQNLSLQLLFNTLLHNLIWSSRHLRISGVVGGKGTSVIFLLMLHWKLLKLLPFKLWHMISDYFPRHDKWEFSYLIWDT